MRSSHKDSAMEWVEQSLSEVEDLSYRINLNANENTLSKTARRFLQSNLDSYYDLSDPVLRAEGTVGRKGDLMYRQLPATRELIFQGEQAALRMLGAGTVDLRPLSGVHAMECAVLGLSEPGDVVASLDPATAGHAATQHIVRRSGRKSVLISVDGAIKEKTDEEPQLIFLDQSLALEPIDIRALRSRFPHSTIVYDASHTLGLILGGVWPNPLDQGADLIQGNTHKTLPGPQKAMIAARLNKIAERLTYNISKGLLSSQHTHHTAALAVTLLEFEQYGAQYSRVVQANTQLFARLLQFEGFELLHNLRPMGHMVVARPKSSTDARIYELCSTLIELGVACNARMIDGSVWLRFGTQEVTRRGALGFEMLQLAILISSIASGKASHAKALVKQISRKLQGVLYSFDSINLRNPNKKEANHELRGSASISMSRNHSVVS